MSDTPFEPADSSLAPVRFENGKALIIAGFGQRYNLATNNGIPALWQDFAAFMGKVPGQVGRIAYGVCCNPDGEGGFEYIAGVEVDTLEGLPEDFRSVELAPRHYAVFEHNGHISGIAQTTRAIWQEWLPASAHEAADAPEFERYDERFDPLGGHGVMEIWLPLKD